MNLNKPLELFLRTVVSGVILTSKLRRNSPFALTKALHRFGPATSKLTDLRSFDEDKSKVIDQEMGNASKYTERSCTCGDLRIDNAGQNVTLCGWLEFQRMNKFVVLRDGYGQTQLVIRDDDVENRRLLNNLPYESVIKVKGTVTTRPINMINRRQPTGEIEVIIDEVDVLNPAVEKLPFNIREFQKAKETLRMQYRYLDLRFPQMQRNLRIRSRVLADIREYLVNIVGFVDVETPTLFKATPGGAQEFVVPTRFPGQFYSLVQSPQQFKQMLMAGGIDRYFQIARCYRDEGSRSDRQPEFSQLDIEMSFTDVDGILALVEDLLRHAWPKFLQRLPSAFQRIRYDEAMLKYGSDKPDLRFDFQLQTCTDILETGRNSITNEFHASCLAFEAPFDRYPKQLQEKLADVAGQYPLAKFVAHKTSSKTDWIEKTGKLLGKDAASDVYDRCNLKREAVIFMTYGKKIQALSLLGKVRIEYVNFLEQSGFAIKQRSIIPVWVVDFPLFEEGIAPGSLVSAHHPFTAPNPQDVHKLDVKPLQVRALSYDLVLNGNEVGGGSMRVHNSSLQEKLFCMLKIDQNSMQHMLDMLSSGCPPHGGIALGLDRLLSVILDTPTIREVIAFPKTFEGRDPVSGAPSAISEREKKMYHIRTELDSCE